jgi:hypothetical protein
MPALPLGEDRAFFDALRLQDARIRHAPDVFVIVSGRLFGRAKGGMAETMRRRMIHPDAWLDDPAEPAQDHLHRAKMRHRLRQAWQNFPENDEFAALCASLEMEPARLGHALATQTFGAAWRAIGAQSKTLERHRVPFAERESQIIQATAILASLEDAGEALVLRDAG